MLSDICSCCRSAFAHFSANVVPRIYVACVYDDVIVVCIAAVVISPVVLVVVVEMFVVLVLPLIPAIIGLKMAMMYRGTFSPLLPLSGSRS